MRDKHADALSDKTSAFYLPVVELNEVTGEKTVIVRAVDDGRNAKLVDYLKALRDAIAAAELLPVTFADPRDIDFQLETIRSGLPIFRRPAAPQEISQ